MNDDDDFGTESEDIKDGAEVMVERCKFCGELPEDCECDFSPTPFDI